MKRTLKALTFQQQSKESIAQLKNEQTVPQPTSKGKKQWYFVVSLNLAFLISILKL